MERIRTETTGDALGFLGAQLVHSEPVSPVIEHLREVNARVVSGELQSVAPTPAEVFVEEKKEPLKLICDGKIYNIIRKLTSDYLCNNGTHMLQSEIVCDGDLVYMDDGTNCIGIATACTVNRFTIRRFDYRRGRGVLLACYSPDGGPNNGWEASYTNRYPIFILERPNRTKMDKFNFSVEE